MLKTKRNPEFSSPCYAPFTTNVIKLLRFSLKYYIFKFRAPFFQFCRSGYSVELLFLVRFLNNFFSIYIECLDLLEAQQLESEQCPPERFSFLFCSYLEKLIVKCVGNYVEVYFLRFLTFLQYLIWKLEDHQAL